MKNRKRYTGWYFLLGVLGIYIIVSLFTPSSVLSSLKFFINIIVQVAPVFLLIFALMTLTNYLVSPKALVKYMGKDSGMKGWIIAIIGGILSTGPAYMWYPLLSSLQKQGVRNALIAIFLYNRAVKIPLLPLIVFYFGLPYTVTLTTVMIIISVFHGILTEKLMEVGKSSGNKNPKFST